VTKNQPYKISVYEFKVCKSVQHRTIQIDHKPDATDFSLLS